MKILICEDEKPTAERLEKLLLKYDPNIEILAKLQSIENIISWFEKGNQPDLVFQDIELSDGNCFEIFEQIEMTFPIIFTTAYSDYALKTFSQNSIDYILKPYGFDDIKKAMEKFKKTKAFFRIPEKEILKKVLHNASYKTRLLTKIGDFYKSLETENIAILTSEDGLSVATLFSNEKHILDKSLNELSQELNPHEFFRINRGEIINFRAIKTIQQWFAGRLQLEIFDGVKVYVSRSRTSDFKEWLGR